MIRPRIEAPEAPESPVRRRRRRLHRAVRMVRVVPSMLTLANLLCGFAAVFYASRDSQTVVLGHWSPFELAAALIFLGMIFDALDGRVARLTRHTSELGEQLDSMADMVTFGVAPAFLLMELVNIGAPFFGSPRVDVVTDRAVLAIAGVYVACCALRLARYNVEMDDGDGEARLSFKGLPSPAAAGTIASLVLLHQSLLTDHADWARWTAMGLILIALAAAGAMVSSMRYAHVANRYLRGRAPFEYVALAVVAVPLLLIIPEVSVAIGFSAYALSRPTGLVVARLTGKGRKIHHGGPQKGTEGEEKNGQGG